MSPGERLSRAATAAVLETARREGCSDLEVAQLEHAEMLAGAVRAAQRASRYTVLAALSLNEGERIVSEALVADEEALSQRYAIECERLGEVIRGLSVTP